MQGDVYQSELDLYDSGIDLPYSEIIHGDFVEFCNRVLGELNSLGIDAGRMPYASVDDCHIELVRDDYDNEPRIIGTWRNSDGGMYARVVRYTNGNMFAEHDVLLPHPVKKDLFIEAIEVWGHAGQLKSEVRLLPAL